MVTEYGTIVYQPLSVFFFFPSPSNFFCPPCRRLTPLAVTFSIRHFPREEVDRPTQSSLPGLRCSPLLKQRLRLTRSRNSSSSSRANLPPPPPKTTSTTLTSPQRPTASAERSLHSILTLSLPTMTSSAQHRPPVSCSSRTMKPRSPSRHISSRGRTVH